MNLLTVSEAAKKLRASKSWMYARIDDGTVPAYKIGGKLLVEESELRAVLEACRIEGKRQRRPRPPRIRSRHA